MLRFRTIIATAGLFVAVPACDQATDERSAAAKAGEAVIVVPYMVEPGRSRTDAMQAIENIAAELRAQPGFVDAQLLEEGAPDGQQQFVHVTRWGSFDDWNAVSGSADFQKVLDANLPYVRVNLTQVYRPVER